MTETVSPRLFRIRPIDATLIPLPSELTTPPVTKINFVGICLRNTIKECQLGTEREPASFQGARPFSNATVQLNTPNDLIKLIVYVER